jgi:hypothetical protein
MDAEDLNRLLISGFMGLEMANRRGSYNAVKILFVT